MSSGTLGIGGRAAGPPGALAFGGAMGSLGEEIGGIGMPGRPWGRGAATGNRPADGAGSGAGRGRRPADGAATGIRPALGAPALGAATGIAVLLSAAGAERTMRGPDGRPPGMSSAGRAAGMARLEAAGAAAARGGGGGGATIGAMGIDRAEEGGASAGSSRRRMTTRGFAPGGSAAPRCR
jgi:hypothetical protein